MEDRIELLKLLVSLVVQARIACVDRRGHPRDTGVDLKGFSGQFRQFVTRLRFCAATGIDIQRFPDDLREPFQMVERIFHPRPERRPSASQFMWAMCRLKDFLDRQKNCVEQEERITMVA